MAFKPSFTNQICSVATEAVELQQECAKLDYRDYIKVAEPDSPTLVRFIDAASPFPWRTARSQ